MRVTCARTDRLDQPLLIQRAHRSQGQAGANCKVSTTHAWELLAAPLLGSWPSCMAVLKETGTKPSRKLMRLLCGRQPGQERIPRNCMAAYQGLSC